MGRRHQRKGCFRCGLANHTPEKCNYKDFEFFFKFFFFNCHLTGHSQIVRVSQCKTITKRDGVQTTCTSHGTGFRSWTAGEHRRWIFRVHFHSGRELEIRAALVRTCSTCYEGPCADWRIPDGSRHGSGSINLKLHRLWAVFQVPCSAANRNIIPFLYWCTAGHCRTDCMRRTMAAVRLYARYFPVLFPTLFMSASILVDFSRLYKVFDLKVATLRVHQSSFFRLMRKLFVLRLVCLWTKHEYLCFSLLVNLTSTSMWMLN